ncbi:hypothetical protein AAFF_G00109700 [Aldrovandia affinis]|uniref:Uncharacterized protein n=1 Tax=Aldrovandia affinis TaxID=143900 RepID=A0AAD7RWC3_9TELE|nr:hypothetical protein AAFF_G00109700 [Aldrovandia affinis]
MFIHAGALSECHGCPDGQPDQRQHERQRHNDGNQHVQQRGESHHCKWGGHLSAPCHPLLHPYCHGNIPPAPRLLNPPHITTPLLSPPSHTEETTKTLTSSTETAMYQDCNIQQPRWKPSHPKSTFYSSSAVASDWGKGAVCWGWGQTQAPSSQKGEVCI